MCPSANTWPRSCLAWPTAPSRPWTSSPLPPTQPNWPSNLPLPSRPRQPCTCPGGYGASTIPTISGNDEFAYGVFDWEEYCCTQFSAFARITGGALEINNTMNVVGPTGNPSGPWYYFPLIAKADPTNHLAVLMYSEDDLVVRQNSIWYKNVMSFKSGPDLRGFFSGRERSF